MSVQTIPKSTFTFLKKLNKNNNRQWFNAHKDGFKKEEQYVKDFYASIRDGMEKFDHIEHHRVHRIYRDIRFSKDKTPYKSHFSGGFKRATNFRRGGYYLHLEPGNSLVAGGFFGPNKDDLLRIRREIEIDAAPLITIMNKPSFKKHFGEIQGDGVKTAPKGFSRDHSHIELLRKKQFYFVHHFNDKEVFGQDFSKKVLVSFKLLIPYFDFMSETLTTDLNGQSII